MCCHSGLSDVKTFGRPSEIQILCSLIEDPETVEIDHGLQSLPSQFPNNPYGSKTTISSDYVYHRKNGIDNFYEKGDYPQWLVAKSSVILLTLDSSVVSGSGVSYSSVIFSPHYLLH